MKIRIGYPCLNWSIGCQAAKTFRLASYGEEHFLETVKNNLSCLQSILEYNKKNRFLFFRISSQTIPFASHPICKVEWQKVFKAELSSIGKYIRKESMRISMHPDQFTLINSPSKKVLENSLQELQYHADFLDALGIDESAKIQIHVGGVYGNKEAAIERFIERYEKLPQAIQKRLVIENDDRLFGLEDCLRIHQQVGIPVLFDTFHHTCLNQGESMKEAIKIAASTWKKKDGPLMVDYSSQQEGARKGKHTESLDLKDFKALLSDFEEQEADIMLEIKDKEKSALKAIQCLHE